MSRYYRHKVFYIRASGIPVPSHEIDTLAYYQADMPDLADSSKRIIDKYISGGYKGKMRISHSP